MTQDEPEREKTIEQHARNVMSAAVVPIRVRVLVDYLVSQISVSEKRAEEAERQLGECSGGYETLEKELAAALVISQNYQSLMVTAQRESGEARRKLDAMPDVAYLTSHLAEAVAEATEARKERDSARLSLSRMWEALKPFAVCADTFEERTPDSPLFRLDGDDMVELEIELGDLRKLHSALHRSQGE